MRIAFFFPRFKTFSGAEHLVLELSRAAVEAGHEVVILTRDMDAACRRRLDSRIEVRIHRFFSALTGNHLVDSFFDMAFSPILLRRLPRDSDVLCFFCPPVVPAMWLYHRVLRGRIPTLYYCLQPPRFAYDLMRETIAANRPLGYLVPLVAVPYRYMDRLMASHCDCLLAISHSYADWCRELYRPPALELVYPGIDTAAGSTARPQRVRERHGFNGGEMLVVTVNKLIARKNVDVFLRAMRLVCNRFPSARGIVVGDGPVKPALLKLHEELGLGERVQFTGFVPDFEGVVDYYAACDVYVFLERNVPFGLTILEAGACSKPVVAVRGGGSNDTIIDGETGFLICEALDPRKVADRICQLLDDDAERLRMGRRGAENARRFSHQVTARRFLEILDAAARGAFSVSVDAGQAAPGSEL